MGQSRIFSIIMERAEGRGGFKVMIDTKSPQDPVRLLAEYNWPPSLAHVKEHLDDTAKAVFSALDGTWQKVLAEVRLRAQCGVEGNDAARYMREHVVRLNPETVESLDAQIGFASVKIETDPLAPREGDDFFGPKRELTLEVLRENRSCLYMEMMSMWPQLGGMPARGEMQLDLSQVRRIAGAPSAYVEHAYEFLTKTVVRLWDGGTPAV